MNELAKIYAIELKDVESVQRVINLTPRSDIPAMATALLRIPYKDGRWFYIEDKPWIKENPEKDAESYARMFVHEDEVRERYDFLEPDSNWVVLTAKKAEIE